MGGEHTAVYLNRHRSDKISKKFVKTRMIIVHYNVMGGWSLLVEQVVSRILHVYFPPFFLFYNEYA